MEYISAEEFLKQPDEVQKVFLDWWKPGIFDAVSFQDDTTTENSITGFGSEENEGLIYCNDDNMAEKEDLIPLFTEGQLRHFIEDKTGKLLKIDTMPCNYYVTAGMEQGIDKDLIQAYWQVACKIAKGDK